MRIIEKLRDEPAVVLVIAAAIVVLGIDLAEISATVERIVQLVALLGAGGWIRHRATPVDPSTGRPRNPAYELRDTRRAGRASF